MGYHARRSPSGAYWWSECTAGPGKTRGMVDKGGDDARWGTAAHLVSETALHKNTEVIEYLSWSVLFLKDGSDELLVRAEDVPFINVEIEHAITVDDKIVECSATYVGFVRDLVRSTGGELHVEQRVPIAHITGEFDFYFADSGKSVDLDRYEILNEQTLYAQIHVADVPMIARNKQSGELVNVLARPAGGSADAIIIDRRHREVIVVDLKGGQGVQVFAYDVIREWEPAFGEFVHTKRANLQAAMYGDGTFVKFCKPEEIDTIRVIIVQPRLHHIQEYRMPVAEMLRTRAHLQSRIHEGNVNPQFRPGKKTCFFCKAKGQCDAQTRYVMSASLEGFGEVGDAVATPLPFVNPNAGAIALSGTYTLEQLYSLVVENAKVRDVPNAQLALSYSMRGVVKDWLNQVDKKVEALLAQGVPVLGGPEGGYKLVHGEDGDRRWTDEAQVAELAQRIGLTPAQTHTEPKFKSPAQIEKLTTRKRGTPEPVLPKTQWESFKLYIDRPKGKPVVAPLTDERPSIVPPANGFKDLGSL